MLPGNISYIALHSSSAFVVVPPHCFDCKLYNTCCPWSIGFALLSGKPTVTEQCCPSLCRRTFPVVEFGHTFKPSFEGREREDVTESERGRPYWFFKTCDQTRQFFKFCFHVILSSSDLTEARERHFQAEPLRIDCWVAMWGIIEVLTYLIWHDIVRGHIFGLHVDCISEYLKEISIFILFIFLNTLTCCHFTHFLPFFSFLFKFDSVLILTLIYF